MSMSIARLSHLYTMNELRRSINYWYNELKKATLSNSPVYERIAVKNFTQAKKTLRNYQGSKPQEGLKG